MRGRLAAGLLGFVAGVSLLVWLRLPDRSPAEGSGAPAGPVGAPSKEDSALSSLEAALAAERSAREALALEVAGLRSELGRLTAPLEAMSPPTPPPPGPTTAPDPGRDLVRAPTPFDEQALLDAGFDSREVERLRSQTEALELEQLYLRDRAIREGWAGTPRFAEEARNLDARGRALREELGDERYDWLLFASGRANRVVVQSVLESSPASEAGLRNGDAILSYGGSRLFDVSALREATAGGRSGESVAIDVARGEERLRVYVPRGPLGVRLEELRQRPSS